LCVILRAGAETRPYGLLVDFGEWEVLDSAAVVDKANNFAARTAVEHDFLPAFHRAIAELIALYPMELLTWEAEVFKEELAFFFNNIELTVDFVGEIEAFVAVCIFRIYIFFQLADFHDVIFLIYSALFTECECDVSSAHLVKIIADMCELYPLIFVIYADFTVVHLDIIACAVGIAVIIARDCVDFNRSALVCIKVVECAFRETENDACDVHADRLCRDIVCICEKHNCKIIFREDE